MSALAPEPPEDRPESLDEHLDLVLGGLQRSQAAKPLWFWLRPASLGHMCRMCERQTWRDALAPAERWDMCPHCDMDPARPPRPLSDED